MTILKWDVQGQRMFDTGVDRVVFYPQDGYAQSWSGVTEITDGFVSNNVREGFVDGQQFLLQNNLQDFEGSITSFSTPRGMMSAEGLKELFPGLYITQQMTTPFGLSYRTLASNELGETWSLIHVLWNCTMIEYPTNTYETLGEDPTPVAKTWRYKAMSPKIVPTEFYDTFRPTPMVVLDTRYMRANAVRVLEQILWGSDNPNVDAYLPDINELIELYRSSAYDVKTTYLGDGLWRAEEEMGEDLSTDGEYFEADLRKAENGLEGEWTLDTDYDTSEETRNDRN